MNHERSRLGLLVAFGSTCAAVVAFAACGGKQLSIGNDNSKLQPVDLATVFSTPPTPCQDNYAHPNVCCVEGPGQSASCGVYPSAPFQACPADQSTYPDPGSCCPLASPGDPTLCGAPPPPGGGGGPGPSCVYPCQPGWYAPAGQPGTCCQTNGETTECAASVTPSCVESCPPCAPGEDAAACGCTSTCPPPSPTPVCDACPPGWQVPAGEPGLCCQTQPNNVIDCFSQAVPPNTGSSVDAGPPVIGQTDASVGVCVNIDLSSYDVSCTQDTDCVTITAGAVCSTACQCGGSAINVSGEATYQAAISGLPAGPTCNCPAEPVPTCVNGTCSASQ